MLSTSLCSCHQRKKELRIPLLLLVTKETVCLLKKKKVVSKQESPNFTSAPSSLARFVLSQFIYTQGPQLGQKGGIKYIVQYPRKYIYIFQ